MSATILPLRGGYGAGPAAAMARLEDHLDRCALAANTVTAYRRQARAHLAWLAEPAHAAEQADAFVDHIGGEAAVAAWRRSLLEQVACPATVNQALAVVKRLYEHGASMRIKTKTARVPPPGAPKALSRTQDNALRRAADRRGARDAAIIALLLGTGARTEDIPAFVARIVDSTGNGPHSELGVPLIAKIYEQAL